MSVRFNIINSIHNFINLESQNQYFYYIIYIIILFLFFGFYKMLLCLLGSKKIPLNNVFTYFLLIFYLFFIVNLDFINLVFLNFLLSIKIKYVYLFIFILIVVILMLVKKTYKIGLLSLITLTIVKLYIFNIIFINQLIDFSILIVVLFYFKKSKSSNKNKQENSIILLHNKILIFFLISGHQIYNFTPFFKKTFNFDLCIKSINNFINNDLGVFYLKAFINTKTDDGIMGLFGGGVFEKKLSYNNIYIFFEQYNYNNQTLIQLYGGLIFVILLLFIFVVYVAGRRCYVSINI